MYLANTSVRVSQLIGAMDKGLEGTMSRRGAIYFSSLLQLLQAGLDPEHSDECYSGGIGSGGSFFSSLQRGSGSEKIELQQGHPQ